MRRATAIALASLLALAPASPALAYLKLGVTVNGQTVAIKWGHTPVRYFVNDTTTVPGVAPTDFAAAAGRAFDTWQGLPTASITYQFGGYVSAQPLDDDGISTLGFLDRPDLDRVLASTDFLVDSTTGELLESDIFFNAAYPWSTAPAGETGRFDVQTIALHEIGHLSGLGHSALGETELRADGGRTVIADEAVMFPIAFAPGNISNRTPKADDVAGLSDLYPDDGFNDRTGSISGRVTKNGQGVFGAHVVAFDPVNGTLVANFTLNSQGAFSIAGLSPGPHVIRVEPVDDADPESFFSSDRPPDVDFKVTFYDKLVVVPAGGDSGSIEVKVVPK